MGAPHHSSFLLLWSELSLPPVHLAPTSFLARHLRVMFTGGHPLAMLSLPGAGTCGVWSWLKKVSSLASVQRLLSLISPEDHCLLPAVSRTAELLLYISTASVLLKGIERGTCPFPFEMRRLNLRDLDPNLSGT